MDEKTFFESNSPENNKPNETQFDPQTEEVAFAEKDAPIETAETIKGVEPIENTAQPTVSFEPIGQPYIYQAPPSPNPGNRTNVVSGNDKSKRSFSFSTLVACMLICALLSTVISAVITMAALGGNDSSEKPSSNIGANNNNNTNTNTNTNTTITNNTDNFVEAVAQKVRPSVVAVVCTYSYTTPGFFGNSTNVADSEGSGVIYSSDGYIITNKHVIEYAISRNAEVSVYLHDNLEKPYKATVVGYDASIDLAVLKIDAKNLPVAEIGDSDKLTVGQNAVAVGNPGGLEFVGSVSVGYISGLNREVTIDSATMNLIQTDTAINPGNSGGALVDNKGKLIGITNAKLISEDFEGMGFAIPVNTVVKICDSIIEGKDNPSPYIGVSIDTSMTSDVLDQYGMPHGAVVTSVVEGGPADKAGIEAYDIIVSVDSTLIKNYDQLVSAINTHKVGDKVIVTVYRDGRYRDFTVTIGANG